MSRRIKFGLASVAIGLVAAAGAPAVLAAATAHLSPANTKVKLALKAGTKTSFTGKLGAVTVTSSCTSSTASFKTPADGLGPIKLTNSKFSGCTDSLHGTDTIKTSGKWTVKFVAKQSGDRVRLTIPKAGATVVSSLVPTCVITVAPSGPVTITGADNDVNTTTFKNVSLPASTTAACPGGAGTGTAKFSATYVSTPHVKYVS